MLDKAFRDSKVHTGRRRAGVRTRLPIREIDTVETTSLRQGLVARFATKPPLQSWERGDHVCMTKTPTYVNWYEVASADTLLIEFRAPFSLLDRNAKAPHRHAKA